ncbi:LamG domain-containing protein [Candidatus Poribacteria bacterium]|nr:LamG domain-containing protein [Candidatus Poribacteria bacterium]MYA58159.1 LamG domain-containing protein [Candidatus Poribacteria bacterium]
MCKCEFSIGINLVRNPQRCYNCLTDFENKLWKPRKPHQRFSVISFVEPVYIGAANNRGNVERHFPGIIDEVRIYDRPLTAAEVTRNFKSKIGLSVQAAEKLPIVWAALKTGR